MDEAKNWTTIAESRFPWEREALEFVRQRFPSHEPYRAWSNFEFIADDGSINEVDLLVFSPQGFFLIEIKSRPGRLSGDAGTWIWETDNRRLTTDNPLIAANTKAKKLAALLQRQKVSRKKGRLPYLETLVFCSAPELQCGLQGTARYHVCLRDRDKEAGRPDRPGIMAAIRGRKCPGLDRQPRGTHDRPTAKTVSQALEQAGIRPSQRQRRVGDYILDEIVADGPGYQDWRASHAQIPETQRWVRLYQVRAEASEEDRQKIERAAKREFQLLEMLQHPGILRTHGFTPHELGPAIIFEYDASSVRLDHYLAAPREALSLDLALDLARQIAEAVRFAHEKKVIHRGLSPQSIFVIAPNSAQPRIKILNWQVGSRLGSSSADVSREITPTSHIDRFVEDARMAYLAPEALTDEATIGEYMDVFSLGAIAYHLFSGVAPAASSLELHEKLRETKGLQISSVLNGASEELQILIQYSTHPEVMERIDSAADFLAYLEAVEDDLTTPADDAIDDPNRAQKGDRLAGNFTVLKRLGQRASSVALLVERDSQEFVLKLASDPEHNTRLRDEAEVLQKLRHPHLVEYAEVLELGDRVAILLRPVLADRETRRVETLGERLRKEGRLSIDLLQRFGEDLLGVVNFLEEQGISHRDIKPDNIAVGNVGSGSRLHLVLFDFSLSRAPADNIRAGTTSYLDPLLPLRKPPRWDLHAERYAAAMTLHELATGTLPQWGDGKTDPSLLDCEITLDAELFDSSLRDGLTAFFQAAFRRNPAERFDNAEDMLRTWRQAFEGVEQSQLVADLDDEETLRQRLAGVAPDTRISELALGTLASNVLDRENILTVEDLLSVPLRKLQRLRGVGNKTRRDIATLIKILREQPDSPSIADSLDSLADEPVPPTAPIEYGLLSVDLLARRITSGGTRDDETSRRSVRALLGLDSQLGDAWPSQSDVGRHLKMSRAQVGQRLGKFFIRWSKEPALTKLRSDMVDILTHAGGVMVVTELAEALLLARGSSRDEPLRTQLALAVARSGIEAEQTKKAPRFAVRRDPERVLVAVSQELAAYASRLGNQADSLAKEDPLVSPAWVLERLRKIQPPTGAPTLSDSRLVQLAAAASRHAAVSSRQELYPRGMDAARALKLSQGALYVGKLSVQELHARVQSRYPEAAKLLDRPELDAVLRDAGLHFEWKATEKKYVSRSFEAVSVSGTSDSFSGSVVEGGEVTPEQADARRFEERLRRGAQEGSFLALVVNPKRYESAGRALSERFPVELVDFEGMFIEALRHKADEAKVDWELVLQADARPYQGDWDSLTRLVEYRAMPLVEERLMRAEKTVLMMYAGLLARYDQMAVLERLRESVGRPGGIPGLWLLLAGDQQAMLEGRAVPLLSPGQRVRVPDLWLR
ncbi:MAG: BREX system serine/threonine kinase PglW [Desulfurellaceae bacterium]|nr:BREX system serine/threonine kinase PglW [Desulfurellaceae bacterium]